MKQRKKLQRFLMMKWGMKDETSDLWGSFICVFNAPSCAYVIRINYEHSHACANAFARNCWDAHESFFTTAVSRYFYKEEHERNRGNDLIYDYRCLLVNPSNDRR